MIATNVACAVEKPVEDKLLGMLYISSLLENFSLGERGLKKKLPCGKDSDACSSNINVNSPESHAPTIFS